MNYEGLYDINYKIASFKPFIFLFIRNKDGTKEKKVITNFKPYFYVKSEMLDVINLSNFLKNKITKIEDKPYITIFGDEVKKIIVKLPSDIYHFRKELGINNTYETDVSFPLRYCIDEIKEIIPTKYKVLYFDIETDTEQGFPDSKNPINPIISISLKDNYNEKNITFIWREDQKERIEENTYYYNNEKDMLENFMNYWKEQDYDIITAWNLNFDIGYLTVRLQKLGIKTDKLGEIKLQQDINNAQVKNIEIFGKVLFDLLSAYKKLHMGDLTSYSLNNVAEEELKEQKEKVYNTGDVWRQDLEKLISYNKKDVDLIYKIDKKCKLISIFDDIRRFAGVKNINDCVYASRIHETRIMKNFRNIIFPNKPPFKEKEGDLSGVLLKEPIPGLYSNVICIDAKSLYPSIIYTFNLSTEMINENGVDINGVKIKQSPKGIMPSMIKELMQLKDDMKKKVEGTGQSVSDKMFAIKQFINSFYGINALSSFRLFNKDIARNIILLGREITSKCSEFVEQEYGYKVIYNDTDSLFIQLPENIDLISKGKEIEIFLDNKINNYCYEKYKVENSIIHMEFEKIFKKLILQRKRRYSGWIIWEDNKQIDKILVKGMAAIRGDTPYVSKIMQNKLLEMILKKTEKKEIIDYLNNLIKKIIKNEIPKEEIAQPVKLNMNISDYNSQNLPKLRGVKWSNTNLKTNFNAGNKFKMIYVKHPNTDVICFEEEEQLKGIDIDWDKQLDKCIFQKIKPIFEVLKWNYEYNKMKLNFLQQTIGQTTLNDFGITKQNFHNW